MALGQVLVDEETFSIDDDKDEQCPLIDLLFLDFAIML